MNEELIYQQIQALGRNTQALEENTAAMVAQANAERELANELATFRALLLSLAYAGEERPNVTAAEMLSRIDGLAEANETLNRMAPRAIDRIERLSTRLQELCEELYKSRRRGSL